MFGVDIYTDSDASMNALIEETAKRSTDDFWGMILLAIVLIFIGIFRLCCTELAWELEVGRYVKNGEPTDFYNIGTKISGAVMIIGGILFIIYSFVA